MKTIVFLMLSIALTATTAFAQKATVEKVDASTVPQVVKDAFANDFSGASATSWEKQSGTNANNKSVEKYVATFQLNGVKSRSRYQTNGTGLSATTYMTAAQLPQAVQDACKTNYVGFTLGSGEKIQSLKTDKFVYRARLRKGSQKLVVYMDETGKEVTKDKIPADIKAEEKADEIAN
jgi:hypothetical protein